MDEWSDNKGETGWEKRKNDNTGRENMEIGTQALHYSRRIRRRKKNKSISISLCTFLSNIWW
ncbi:unnamed protein product [Periconia digitata]|uniref:Uncharacterized protein n=1 Tax=Periconia digitata TaxID=1303443 RepID=A0A9W4UAH4_9PLEO|nr:unnamed protein product [Periconia digitata]